MNPLTDKRIIITRAAEQAGPLAERLMALRAEPLICSTIAFAPPLDCTPIMQALEHLATYDWLIFTSAQAVQAVYERLQELIERTQEPNAAASKHSCIVQGVRDLPVRTENQEPLPGTIVPMANQYTLTPAADFGSPMPRIAAVGKGTADAARRYRFCVDLVPDDQSGIGLAGAFGDVAGKRILLPQADIGRVELAGKLRETGALVETVTAYRTVPGPGALRAWQLLCTGQADAIVFSSPSTLNYLLEARPADATLDHLRRIALICIGHTTAAALRQHNLTPTAVAAEPSVAGLVAALSRCFAA